METRGGEFRGGPIPYWRDGGTDSLRGSSLEGVEMQARQRSLEWPAAICRHFATFGSKVTVDCEHFHSKFDELDGDLYAHFNNRHLVQVYNKWCERPACGLSQAVQ